MDYAAATDEALLDALVHAGRHPDPDLLRACLARREALTPALLDLFAADLDAAAAGEERADWDEDDPRWYREIHAGRLLLAFREPAALPTFTAYFRDPEYELYLEWFEGATLGVYGPAAVPYMLDLLQDETAWVWGRVLAQEVLGQIAAYHPAERDRILAALRAQLPPLRSNGKPAVPAEPVDHLDVLWTDVVYTLARLGERESEPVVRALFRHHLLDEMVFGGKKEYLQIRNSNAPQDRFELPVFDLLETYAAQKQRDEYWSPEAARARLAEMKEDEPDDEADALRALLPAHDGGSFARSQPKVGRNAPCPCGSGLKYKKCCGRRA